MTEEKKWRLIGAVAIALVIVVGLMLKRFEVL
jgi:hypothetical protein